MKTATSLTSLQMSSVAFLSKRDLRKLAKKVCLRQPFLQSAPGEGRHLAGCCEQLARSLAGLSALQAGLPLGQQAAAACRLMLGTLWQSQLSGLQELSVVSHKQDLEQRLE